MLSKMQSTDGAWYTAVEGRVNDDNEFVPRQSVFRTQENFWEAGWHNWQVNEAASPNALPGTPDLWNATWQGAWAETRIPPNALVNQLSMLCVTN